MSTDNDAADFYVGRAEQAEYLGTRTHEGAPEQVDIFVRFQLLSEEEFTQEQFRAETADLINFRSWPWTTQENSLATPWTYMYDRGTLYVYRYGVEMARLLCSYGRNGRDGREPRLSAASQFPAMYRINPSPAFE